MIAGPFAARLFAEFGAEVIKIEPPDGGDPLRTWRHLYEGTSLWWYVQSHNKKSVTLDLRQDGAREIVLQLAAKVDVLIENFKPGTMEKWGLGWDDLEKVNPGLIMVRVSGYGQTGPYRNKPGFGSIGEAMGGIRYLTGYPDRPPTRVGVSLGDSVAGLYAFIGGLLALRHREVRQGKGQVVDVALYEAVFSLMEGLLPEYSALGVIRERTGTILPGIAPSNTYRCADGKYIVIGGNSDGIFKRLMLAVGRPDLAEDPRLARNDGRVAHMEEIDAAISAWTATKSIEEALEAMDKAGVPAGKIYNAADIAADPHYRARGMAQETEIPGLGKILVPGLVPTLSETPGQVRWLGPKLGAHNEEVYCGLLGYSREMLQQWKEKGLI
ncbi:MAG: CoA transferase [Firmicutes bacterium]|nr:CoA transferase [Bacillota bacterium]MCL5040723.1 CoA transferase [Bacillota bacterium]